MCLMFALCDFLYLLFLVLLLLPARLPSSLHFLLISPFSFHSAYTLCFLCLCAGSSSTMLSQPDPYQRAEWRAVRGANSNARRAGGL